MEILIKGGADVNARITDTDLSQQRGLHVPVR